MRGRPLWFPEDGVRGGPWEMFCCKSRTGGLDLRQEGIGEDSTKCSYRNLSVFISVL